MADKQKRQLVTRLLDRFGHSFVEELNIHLEQNTPSPLFRLLVFALLASARISHDIAIAAARDLAGQHWNSAHKMAEASWRARTDTLNRAGYARYDESTSRMLGETAEHLPEYYQGDLRRLREQAKRQPEVERRLLKRCKGIGDVGVDIFFREAQLVWDEHYPFADRRVLDAAARLGLGDSAQELQRWVSGRAEYTRLSAALVRAGLAGAYEELSTQAA